MSLSPETMAALRFGYGFRVGEKRPASSDDLMAQITTGAAQTPAFPVEGIEARRALITQDADRLSMPGRDNGTARRQARKLVRPVSQALFQRDVQARMIQAVTSPLGFYERLATFWTDHFSVSADKSLPMKLLVPLFEAEAIRPHIGGRFVDLLRSATEHPAMLIYLDQAQSRGPASKGGMKNSKGLNENLARELLELHTLGAGSGYSQADVRATAMVLTGLTLDRNTMQAAYRPGFAEPGAHAVLGRRYGGKRPDTTDHEALLADLAAHPQTAAHIAQKLAVHFVADRPDPDLVASMAERFRTSDGDLSAVYRAMLDHPASWREAGAKARQPYDFIVAGLRALDSQDGDVQRFMTSTAGDDPTVASPRGADMAMMDTPEGMPSAVTNADARKARQTARALGNGAMKRMGQPLWQPPSPAGFDEGFSAWITAGQLAERLAWARRAAATFGKDQDPRAFLKATLGDAARDDTIRVVSQAPSKVSGVMLVLAAPEFNRR